MATIQALVLLKAYNASGEGELSRREYANDVTVLIDGGKVRLIAHHGPEISMTREDVSCIVELLAAYDAAAAT